MNPFAALSNGSSDEDSANEKEVDPDVQGPHAEPEEGPEDHDDLASRAETEEGPVAEDDAEYESDNEYWR